MSSAPPQQQPPPPQQQQQQLQEQQQHLMRYVGVAGQQLLQHELATTLDPQQSIARFEESASLQNAALRPLLQFLDVMQVRRADVYERLLERAKARLAEELRAASDKLAAMAAMQLPPTQQQSQLQAMLDALLMDAFPFVAQRPVQDTVLDVMMRVSDKEQYLAALRSSPEILAHVPMDVKRMVWLYDVGFFLEYAWGCLEAHAIECGAAVQLLRPGVREPTARLTELVGALAGCDQLVSHLLRSVEERCVRVAKASTRALESGAGVGSAGTFTGCRAFQRTGTMSPLNLVALAVFDLVAALRHHDPVWPAPREHAAYHIITTIEAILRTDSQQFVNRLADIAESASRLAQSPTSSLLVALTLAEPSTMLILGRVVVEGLLGVVAGTKLPSADKTLAIAADLLQWGCSLSRTLGVAQRASVVPFVHEFAPSLCCVLVDPSEQPDDVLSEWVEQSLVARLVTELLLLHAVEKRRVGVVSCLIDNVIAPTLAENIEEERVFVATLVTALAQQMDAVQGADEDVLAAAHACRDSVVTNLLLMMCSVPAVHEELLRLLCERHADFAPDSVVAYAKYAAESGSPGLRDAYARLVAAVPVLGAIDAVAQRAGIAAPAAAPAPVDASAAAQAAEPARLVESAPADAGGS